MSSNFHSQVEIFDMVRAGNEIINRMRAHGMDDDAAMIGQIVDIAADTLRQRLVESDAKRNMAAAIDAASYNAFALEDIKRLIMDDAEIKAVEAQIRSESIMPPSDRIQRF